MDVRTEIYGFIYLKWCPKFINNLHIIRAALFCRKLGSSVLAHHVNYLLRNKIKNEQCSPYESNISHEISTSGVNMEFPSLNKTTVLHQ